MEPQYRFCTSADGTRISFSTLGGGRRTPGINVESWASTQEGLWRSPMYRAVNWTLAQDRCVVAFDRRGVGASQRSVEDLSLEAQVADLRAIAEQLEFEHFDLFGGFDGSAVALAYAARYPEQVRRLGLWSPSARGADTDAGQARGLAELVRSNWELATRSIANAIAFPSGPVEAQREFAKLLRESTSPEVAATYIEFQASVDVSSLLPQITVPTLIFHPRQSQVVPISAVRAVAELIPNARLTLLGGDTYDESGEEQLEVVREFLDELQESEAAQPPSGAAATVRLGAAVADIPPERRSAELANPQIQYATTSDGVSIAWAEAGQGPALLYCGTTPFTHAQEQFAVFEAYFGALARSFRLITFDARGTGMSERDVADVSTATLLMDAESVIDAAKLDRFVVVGTVWLLAVSTALQLATVLPERVTHLALESPFQNMGELADTPLGRTSRALAEADWAVYAQTLFRVLGGWDAADSTWVDPLARAAAGWVDPSVGLQYMRLWEATDVGHLLAGVRQPTLVLRNDPNLVPARCCQRIAAKIPGAQFRQYSDPTFEQQVELIRAFVRPPSPEPAVDDFLGVAPEESSVASGTGATIRVPSGFHTFAAGRYTVTRLLGEGAQKIVYLVHDAALERDCALALLKAEVLDADGLARVRREGQAMARLTHPNIVTVYDIGDEDGRPYLVCEYVPGGDLRQELDRAGGSLPLQRALAIAEDLCSALAFAHSQGIIHRDVKPSNVHVARDGSAKLGDFGLALAADRSRLTMAGTAMGTAAYMAPEQARGQPVDARSDLYSLGCLLYELITGRPPFTGDDPMAVVSQHVHAVPEPPSQHNAQVPRDLEQLVLGLLAKAREERPSSADEALAELKRIAAAS